jgi:hypothetical protein
MEKRSPITATGMSVAKFRSADVEYGEGSKSSARCGR